MREEHRAGLPDRSTPGSGRDRHASLGGSLMYTTAKDFTVVLENRPGNLWKAANAISSAGVNVDGFSGSAECGNTFHFLFTTDAPSAKRALETAGLKVKTEREVLLVDVEDRPGAAA